MFSRKHLKDMIQTNFMCFKQDGVSFSLNGMPLKLEDVFIYLGSNIWSIENDVNICIGKTWTVIGRLTAIWKSDLIK